jgi:single-stranded-DNA-specific exonuclease
MVRPEWKLRPFDQDQLWSLSRSAELHPLIAQLLWHRGIDDAESARAFLEVRRDSLHDPELLPGAVEAAERLVRATREGRKIVIYGDYDVDGVCGTSLLWGCLRLAGATDVEYYIPHRVDEGYGLNADALRFLALERGANVVVTVDCGVSAVAEARLARSLGLELIITDHHTPGPAWPEADVVVHPRAPGGSYPFGELCGAGVAFKVAWQVCKSFGDGKRSSPHLRDYLIRAMNLVALATVADVVPLGGENRVFVKHGLAGLARDPSAGLRALMEVSNCAGRERLTSGTIAFSLAPRLNAAGRMEQARMAVELLTTDDANRAVELARELDACNARRQETERVTLEEARAAVEALGSVAERGAIVVGKQGWHPGVIGIVASRLVEIYHRPAIVVALGDTVAQGSGRSVTGFDLHEALCACAEGLLGFGGHKAAAGVKLEPVAFDDFARRFDEHCRQALLPEHRTRTLLIDAEVPLGVLSLALVQKIEAMEPFGVGNPRPLFLVTDAQVAGPPAVIGKDGKHVRLPIRQGSVVLKAVGWNMAERLGDLAPGTLCSLLVHPMINTWQHRERVELEVRDLRVTEGSGKRVELASGLAR